MLGKDIRGCRAWKEEHVQDTGFGDPVCLGRFTRNGMRNVDPGFRAYGIEDGDGGICRVSVHEGNGAVERHGRVCEILEDVGIVETEGFGVGWVWAGGSWERETGCVLGNAVDVGMVGEGNVERKGFGA